jgi:hypothetical protein
VKRRRGPGSTFMVSRTLFVGVNGAISHVFVEGLGLPRPSTGTAVIEYRGVESACG